MQGRGFNGYQIIINYGGRVETSQKKRIIPKLPVNFPMGNTKHMKILNHSKTLMLI